MTMVRQQEELIIPRSGQVSHHDLARAVAGAEDLLGNLIDRWSAGLDTLPEIEAWLQDMRAWSNRALAAEILLMAAGYIVPKVDMEREPVAFLKAWATFFRKIRQAPIEAHAAGAEWDGRHQEMRH